MSQLAESLHDVFAGLGPVRIARMFGGHGVYHDGLMFALVVRDTLYLKADDATLPQFEALGLPAFRFERQGRVTQTSYRQAPETVFEDRQQAALWARRAFEAALRSANAPRPAARTRRLSAPPAAPARQGAGRKPSSTRR